MKHINIIEEHTRLHLSQVCFEMIQGVLNGTVMTNVADDRTRCPVENRFAEEQNTNI